MTLGFQSISGPRDVVRQYRRPTWVNSFWRGPVDGPVLPPRDTVRVVRPLTDEELEAQ